MKRRFVNAAVPMLAAFIAATAPAIAQSIPPSATEDERRSIYTIQIENDVFNRLWPSDRDYTSGVRVGWLSPAITEMSPGFAALTTVPTFFGEATPDSVIRRFALSVGQAMYTPENVFTSQPIYNDRPYAAWLYASLALQYTYKRNDPKTGIDEPIRLDTLQLDVGVIGPAAGGEFVQNNFHTLIGVAKSYGWANQLHNEPTLGLTFERRWRTGRAVLIEDPKLEVDFIPRIGASLGNVATYAGVGGTARIGKNLSETTLARRALGQLCQVPRRSSAMVASAGICLPASTARPSHGISFSTATRTGTACEFRIGRLSANCSSGSPFSIAGCGCPIRRCCGRRNFSSASAFSSSARSISHFATE